MLEKKDLQAIAELMDAKLEPMRKQLASIQEDTKVTREATNTLIDWADRVEKVIGVPFARAAQ